MKTRWGLKINCMLLRFEYEVTPLCSATVAAVLQLRYKLELWSWPDPQWSGRSSCTGGFSETGKHWGSGETCQELAAFIGDVDESWTLPEPWWPLPYTCKSSPGSASHWQCCQQDRQTEQGTAVPMEVCAGRASSPYQLKVCVQLMVITLSEGAWLWYPLGRKLCPLHCPEWMWQPRQLPWKSAAIQISDCRGCQSIS